MNPRSQLTYMQGQSFWDAEQIRQQAARLWLEKGAVVNAANKLFGKR